MFIHLTILLASDYKETLLESLTYSGKEKQLLNLTNVEYQHDNLLFYKDKSHLTFNRTVPTASWSVEIDLNVPKFEYPHQSALYFWYTKDQIKENNENFHGFVGGIEFIGSATELMFAIHEKKDNTKVIKDFLEPTLLKEKNKITMKIIHTPQNLKLEMYSNTFLIYDHLKLLDKDYFGNHEENGYVSMSYTTNTSEKEQGISVSQIRFYERTEFDNYDPLKEINLPKEENLEKDKLEISNAVAKLDHFFKYIQIVMGKPTLGTISKMASLSNKEIKKLVHELSKLKTSVEAQKEFSADEIQKSATNLESRVRDLQKEMMDMQKSIRAMIEAESKLAVNLYYVLLASVFGVVGMALRTFVISQKGKNKLAN
ncbi:Concanavalin A-like lectin glucanase [Tubulinosema ratisbonensis]|uniref:Concanavalin A-like lectin glucanase n=2 Tax=Tubulinosema ratisbonensis TaxID=291195 RepID=A0A437ALG2_9MICR|nr:Concanavalin A-like lectin glucanase [Tubulinosema ratisbonensis]